MNTELIARMKNAADVIGGNIAAVLQDAVRELESAPDLSDVAYLAKGFGAALQKLSGSAYRALSDGYGEQGLIDEMLSRCVPLVSEAWAAVGEDGVGGVWAYEVCEPLGHWWVSAAGWGTKFPTEAATRAEIARLVERMG